MRLSRLGLLLTPLLIVLLVVGCTDPITSGPYQDQNQPASPGRVMVYPPYDPAGHPEYPGTLQVYREWVGGQPVPLDKPYITMYQSSEAYYLGFKVWRKGTGESNWEELTVDGNDNSKNMVPETKRDVPITADDWADSSRRIIYDEPNVVFDASNVELDFPAYRPDLDGFKGDQNPIDGWDVNNTSGYYPYRYFFPENHTFGFIDTGFDVTTMDYEDYKWAVCFVDHSGNESDPVIVEVN